MWLSFQQTGTFKRQYQPAVARYSRIPLACQVVAWQDHFGAPIRYALTLLASCVTCETTAMAREIAVRAATYAVDATEIEVAQADKQDSA
jgi:hypothetical protein